METPVLSSLDGVLFGIDGLQLEPNHSVSWKADGTMHVTRADLPVYSASSSDLKELRFVDDKLSMFRFLGSRRATIALVGDRAQGASRLRAVVAMTQTAANARENAEAAATSAAKAGAVAAVTAAQLSRRASLPGIRGSGRPPLAPGPSNRVGNGASSSASSSSGAAAPRSVSGAPPVPFAAGQQLGAPERNVDACVPGPAAPGAPADVALPLLQDPQASATTDLTYVRVVAGPVAAAAESLQPLTSFAATAASAALSASASPIPAGIGAPFSPFMTSQPRQLQDLQQGQSQGQGLQQQQQKQAPQSEWSILSGLSVSVSSLSGPDAAGAHWPAGADLRPVRGGFLREAASLQASIAAATDSQRGLWWRDHRDVLPALPSPDTEVVIPSRRGPVRQSLVDAAVAALPPRRAADAWRASGDGSGSLRGAPEYEGLRVPEAQQQQQLQPQPRYGAFFARSRQPPRPPQSSSQDDATAGSLLTSPSLLRGGRSSFNAWLNDSDFVAATPSGTGDGRRRLDSTPPPQSFTSSTLFVRDTDTGGAAASESDSAAAAFEASAGSGGGFRGVDPFALSFVSPPPRRSAAGAAVRGRGGLRGPQATASVRSSSSSSSSPDPAVRAAPPAPAALPHRAPLALAVGLGTASPSSSASAAPLGSPLALLAAPRPADVSPSIDVGRSRRFVAAGGGRALAAAMRAAGICYTRASARALSAAAAAGRGGPAAGADPGAWREADRRMSKAVVRDAIVAAWPWTRAQLQQQQQQQRAGGATSDPGDAISARDVKAVLERLAFGGWGGGEGAAAEGAGPGSCHEFRGRVGSGARDTFFPLARAEGGGRGAERRDEEEKEEEEGGEEEAVPRLPRRA